MISSRTSLGRTPRDRLYLFCEFVLTYIKTSEYISPIDIRIDFSTAKDSKPHRLVLYETNESLNLSLATWRQLKQQQRKYDTCTAHSCRYYKQIADRKFCFGGTQLYLGQCNLGGTHKSNSPDSSKQIQSYKYEIFTRRDCTHWLVSYEANKSLNLSIMEIFPDMRIYFAYSVNGSLNLSLQIGNCQL